MKKHSNKTKKLISLNHADFSGKKNPMFGTHRFKTKNPNYKNGKCLKRYFCISCDKEISLTSACYGSHKCVTCIKIGRKGKKGKLNPNWQDGITKYKYSSLFNNYLKLKIRTRDNFTCQHCGIKEKNCYRKLDVHHIDYNKENCKEDNLITLCWNCNIKANFDRDYWFAYYTYLMKKDSL
jgi:hypothetical protein